MKNILETFRPSFLNEIEDLMFNVFYRKWKLTNCRLSTIDI